MELKDIKNRVVNVGDQVVVLVKERGYMGKITDCFMTIATFKGLTQWGFEFRQGDAYCRIKDPYVYKIQKGIDMKLIFKSATSHSCLAFETKTKRYTLFDGFGSNAIFVRTNKDINALELQLVKEGYRKV